MIRLDQKYSLTLFQEILSSLFGEEIVFLNTPSEISTQKYWKYIQSMRRIGNHDAMELPIYVVVHSGKNDPRISLTKEIFKTLANTLKQRALVALYSNESSTWRLSLVTITLDIDTADQLTRTYSNARRYSFLLWEGEKIKTPTESLLLRWKVNDFTDLISRFSVEVVRKEFFNDYIDAFIRLYIAVLADTKFVSVLQEEWVDIVKFTKNLLGKIVFVYFVQKKWWLWLNRDGEWGYGDRDFVRSLWDRFASWDTFVRPSTNNFYNDYLEHLFYNGFNKDRRDDNGYEPVMRMKVPYLNGWLFKEDYKNWEFFDAKISNDIFSNTAKTGILDIFDTYNFTIDEDDIHDSEVAVDPEMLGKIFEKMISVSSNNIDEIVAVYQKKWKVQIGKELNKQFGAFYTPREIVHYMTRESLIAYLSNGLRGSREENEKKIRTLISAKDRHLSKAGDIDNLIELEILISIAEEIDMLLQRVKILDPAVGSWAFPMGILHEISTLRYYLHSEGFCTTHHHEDEYGTENLVQNGHISMYQIKRDTIKNSIYGVDIEPGAIDIARLRFWLSLVVDAEAPEPLPNFEFKFVAANTLIPLEAEITKDQLAFDLGKNELNLKTLRKYMTEYYNANSKIEKKRLEERITSYVTLDGTDEVTQTSMVYLSTPRRLQLSEFRPFDSNHSNPFFDPSLMMGEGRGFDIVIGNPPYGSDISKLIKLYEKIYKISNKKYFEIYKMFFDFGLKLVKKWAVLSYITPNTFLSQPRYKDIREFLLNFKLDKIINLWENVFDDIVASVAITFIQNRVNDLSYIFADKSIDSKYVGNMNNLLFSPMDINTVLSTKDKNLYSKYDLKSNEIVLDDILELKDAWIQYHRTWIWLKNKWWNDLYERLFSSDPAYFPNCTPTYYGKLIGTYSMSPTTDEYFNMDYKDILNKNESVSFWRHIFNMNEKILWRQTASFPKATLDTSGKWFRNTIQCWFLKKESKSFFDIKYILSLLNSTLIRHKYNSIVRESWKVFPQVKLTHLRSLPIKNISPSDQQPFITLVDAILSAKRDNPQADTSSLEKQIDTLVYKLYDLTPEEISVIVKSSEK